MSKEKDIQQRDKGTEGLFRDACSIIEQAQVAAYRTVNEVLIKRNWLLGMRIQHEVLMDKRAEYGEKVIENLASKLTERYGKGFIKRNLHHYVDFYQKHKEFFQSSIQDSAGIVNAVSSQLLTSGNNLMNALRSQSPISLSWTHYRIILQESNADARDWYEQEAAREMWSTRTLQRNVSSQYYHRLLQSQNKKVVHDEMVMLTKPLQDKLEYLKNPIVAEFLGFKNNTNYSESSLEQSIIDHLIPFLMELGKGFALVDRQKHIHTEKEDYYIDLVFIISTLDHSSFLT